MLRIFYPTERIDSVYNIPFQKLFDEEEMRGVIFDIDNTLVGHGQEATEKTLQLMEELKEMGMKLVLLSNNDEDRVAPFGKMLDVPYVYNARKPTRRAMYKALAQMGTNTFNTVFVGDQIFTDILCANRFQMKNYLVDPIHPREDFQIVLKRKIEKVILYIYEKKGNKSKKKPSSTVD